MRDAFNEFVDRHEIVWELAMGFLAVLYVAVGFAQDDAAAPSTALLYSVETTLTAIFVGSLRRVSPPRGIGSRICAATGSMSSRSSRSRGDCGSLDCCEY